LRDEPDRRVRDQEIRLERDVPSLLRKFVPAGALRYVERGVWKKPAGPLDVDVEVPAIGDRFKMHAVYAVNEIVPGRCRRDFTGSCDIRIPLVGGKAEKIIVDNMLESYEDAARVHREWLAKQKQP
jgi:hypothetical protein